MLEFFIELSSIETVYTFSLDVAINFQQTQRSFLGYFYTTDINFLMVQPIAMLPFTSGLIQTMVLRPSRRAR